jgi:hypothetical protein
MPSAANELACVTNQGAIGVLESARTAAALSLFEADTGQRLVLRRRGVAGGIGAAGAASA